MKEKLLNLLKNSYSPYSNFRVSAIVVMKDGNEFKGTNIENVSYGVTMCAERVAIFNAIVSGYRKNDFEKLYIMCDSKDICTCCFSCRQVISEFFENDKEIICMNNLGNSKTFKVEELCPYSFKM